VVRSDSPVPDRVRRIGGFMRPMVGRDPFLSGRQSEWCVFAVAGGADVVNWSTYLGYIRGLVYRLNDWPGMVGTLTHISVRPVGTHDLPADWCVRADILQASSRAMAIRCGELQDSDRRSLIAND